VKRTQVNPVTVFLALVIFFLIAALCGRCRLP
jgi:hypothetical protein